MTAPRRPEPLATLLDMKRITEAQASSALRYRSTYECGLPSALVRLEYCTVEDIVDAAKLMALQPRDEAQHRLHQLQREMELDSDHVVAMAKEGIKRMEWTDG